MVLAMGEKTGIEWCDSTFNPWIGCTKISPGCDNCYAESLAKRFGHSDRWKGSIHVTSDALWRRPIAWNRAAAKSGKRRLVFCASLADVFDNQAPIAARERLFDLIKQTPALTWLLLTKRPKNFGKFLPADWGDGYKNVWLGVSVEDQRNGNIRIPHLLATSAAKRFISYEPALGPINFRHIDADGAGSKEFCQINALTGKQSDMARPCRDVPRIDWIIAGGESGAGSPRPAHPDWFRSVRDDCASAGVAYFFKQWGEWKPWARNAAETCSGAPAGFQFALHVTGKFEIVSYQEFAELETKQLGWVGMCRAGKRAAGALLDGREHREFPQ